MFVAVAESFVKVADRERKFVVRFAVGDGRGLRSSVWRVWKGRNKDDIYIAPRPMVSVLKGSLHESGLCYFSITSQHQAQMIATGAARERRALTRWKRLFHRNGDPTTNKWAAEVIAKETTYKHSYSPAV